MMSDTLILGIVQIIVTGLIGLYVKWRAAISDRLTRERAEASDALTIEKSVEVKKEVSAVKEEVGIIKTQTDGMHTELVATKQELGEAIGKALGKAEQKAETDADKLKPTPDTVVKVEVVNEPLHVVTPVVPDVPIKVEVTNEPLKVVTPKEPDK